MEQQASSSNESPRIGYIRTTSHPNKSEDEIYRLICDYVHQTRPTDLWPGIQRHHFIFGATTVADSFILSLLVKKTTKSSNHDANLTSAGIGSGVGHFNGIKKEDLSVHMSRARAATSHGQKILRFCRRTGIQTILSGSTDEQCDEIMLEKSTYLIDFHTIEHSRRADWFWRHARVGQAEDNELTNAKYKKENASESRLRMRYAGYGWNASSGGYHGNGSWNCNVCGGKCKRDWCRNGGSARRESELRAYEERELEWTKEWALMPGKKDERWRYLTAELMCWRYSLRSRLDSRERREWTSIATFSGE